MGQSKATLVGPGPSSKPLPLRQKILANATTRVRDAAVGGDRQGEREAGVCPWRSSPRRLRHQACFRCAWTRSLLVSSATTPAQAEAWAELVGQEGAAAAMVSAGSRKMTEGRQTRTACTRRRWRRGFPGSFSIGWRPGSRLLHSSPSITLPMPGSLPLSISLPIRTHQQDAHSCARLPSIAIPISTSSSEKIVHLHKGRAKCYAHNFSFQVLFFC